MKVGLEVNDQRWFALAAVAERAGVTVGAMLAPEVDAIIAKLLAEHQGDPRGVNPYAKDRPYDDPTRRGIVARMWKGGHSSVAIGKRMGTTNLRKIRSTIWDLGFDPAERIGHPPSGHRPRRVTLNATEREAIAA